MSQLRNRQTKLESLTEVLVNIASGFLISYLVWMFVIPVLWPQHQSNMAEAFGITTLFTVTSVARSYIWRRLFEREVHRLVLRIFRGKPEPREPGN